MRLLISDLHLEDTPLTEYRWGIFDFLEKVIKTEKIDSIYILGDLTEKKDNHSSKLVNRLVDNLSRFDKDILILKGNHDYFDTPFFKFLSYMDNVHFISEPTYYGGSGELFIPYSKELDISAYQNINYLFLHHEFLGAKLQNGYVLDKGLEPLTVDYKVYSGHIHQKQKIGDITYIGAPYPIYFGDNDYQGGCFIITNGKYKFIPYNTIARWGITISSIGDLETFPFKPKDQVKLRIKLARHDLHLYDKLVGGVRAILKKLDVLLVSTTLEPIKSTSRTEVTPTKSETTGDIINRFAAQENLSEKYILRGKELVN
jgi:DNA repair exonuclease SbcCD nuclease subunit